MAYARAFCYPSEMRKWFFALPVVCFSFAAHGCPEPSEIVLFHSCWGDAKAKSLLLPEESLTPPAGFDRLIVTGGYTGKDVRPEQKPNPVGMFIHRGRIVNPTLARMDGIVILSPGGALDIHHRSTVREGGGTHDLQDLRQRRVFQNHAAASGKTVFQSHLLISDGTLDISLRENAPRAVRRLLMADEHGFAVYQTQTPMTLFDAAEELREKLRPRMAVNLDMGGHDYCLATKQGIETNCGILARKDTAKLSNILVFSLKPRG